MRMNPILVALLIALGYVAATWSQHQPPELPIYQERPTLPVRPPTPLVLGPPVCFPDLQGPILQVNADGRLLAVCPRCQQEWVMTRGDDRYGALPDPHIYAMCKEHHLIYWRGGECPLCESATAHPEKQ